MVRTVLVMGGTVRYGTYHVQMYRHLLRTGLLYVCMYVWYLLHALFYRKPQYICIWNRPMIRDPDRLNGTAGFQRRYCVNREREREREREGVCMNEGECDKLVLHIYLHSTYRVAPF